MPSVSDGLAFFRCIKNDQFIVIYKDFFRRIPLCLRFGKKGEGPVFVVKFRDRNAVGLRLVDHAVDHLYEVAFVDARFLNVGRAVASAFVAASAAGCGENEKAYRKQRRKDNEQQITVFFLHIGFPPFFSDS